MAKQPFHTPDELRQLLRYEADTGAFYWLPRNSATAAGKTFNTRYAGNAAFRKTSEGYWKGSVENRTYWAHRVAWAVHYGAWPTWHIDHINGDRKDNRIANLRDVPRGENQRNMRRMKSNTSGVTGISETPDGTWDAYIDFEGRRIRLGKHKTFDEAVAARRAAEARYGFHANHGRE